jgi:hypothetical protein
MSSQPGNDQARPVVGHQQSMKSVTSKAISSSDPSPYSNDGAGYHQLAIVDRAAVVLGACIT